MGTVTAITQDGRDQMIVMPANSGMNKVHYWQGKYGGLGHLYSIDDRRGPYSHLPYAMDNGRFPAWSSGKEWDRARYLDFLAYYKSKDARWALVPDVVGDARETRREWSRWAADIFDMGYKLAYAVQDGMVAKDVPLEAEVIFVGGSTGWKWDTAPMWCAEFPRVHIARVNTYGKLVRCAKMGAESVDGTGFMRAPDRYAELHRFILEQAGGQHVPDPGCHVAQSRFDFEGEA